jgi:hypothetical protein
MTYLVDTLAVPSMCCITINPCNGDKPMKNKPQPKQQEGHDQSPQPHPQRQRSKSTQQVLVDLLTRADGATIAQIVAATDWQAHSVRGVMSGVLKKKLGLHITSTKSSGGERVYRIHATVTKAA